MVIHPKHQYLRWSADLRQIFDPGERMQVRVPVQFTAPMGEVMRRTAMVGRENGRDRTWEPRNLGEAISEALLYASAPDDCGMIFRDPACSQHPTLFEFRMEVELIENSAKIHSKHSAYLPDGFRDTFHGLMLGLLNCLDTSPLDFGFEVIGEKLPFPVEDAHAELKLHEVYERCRFTPEAPGLFVP